MGDKLQKRAGRAEKRASKKCECDMKRQEIVFQTECAHKKNEMKRKICLQYFANKMKQIINRKVEQDANTRKQRGHDE